MIDQAIDQWQDCFNACVKAKGKHCEHLMCFYVTVKLLRLLSLHQMWFAFYQVV